MTETLFTVQSDSHYWRGTPWADKVVSGVTIDACRICGRPIVKVDRAIPIQLTLKPDKGTFWPDVLGCGGLPLLILSQGAVAAWRGENLGTLPAGQIQIIGKVPPKLRALAPMEYSWIDGRELCFSRIDPAESGFVAAQKCIGCGLFNYDVSTTYQKQRAWKTVYSFCERPGSDVNLFTSDISPYIFFCTTALTHLATKHRLTNFRFVPLEWGVAYSGKALRYLDQSI